FRSMVPGVATPMAAMSASVSLAAVIAWRIASHIVSRPWSWPRSGSVGRLTVLSGRPAPSTTPAFMAVPPTSSPTYFSGSLMLHAIREPRRLVRRGRLGLAEFADSGTIVRRRSARRLTMNHRLVHHLVLLAAAALLTLPGLGDVSLWDMDEGLNAEAAREMYE